MSHWLESPGNRARLAVPVGVFIAENAAAAWGTWRASAAKTRPTLSPAAQEF